MNRDPNRYVMGVDLGQASDFTAIAVGRFPAAREARSVDVVYLERLPLGTSYPDVVEYVESLMARPPLLGGADLVVDATGVGRPVVDLLRERHLKVEAVTITAGSATRRDDLGGWWVPKRELVSAVQVGLQSRTLRIARDLKHAATLSDELATFEVKITESANETFGAWRAGAHDDLVLAVAMLSWWAWRAPGPVEFW